MRILGTLRPGAADLVTVGNALCGVTAMVYVLTQPRPTGPDAVTDQLRVVALLLLAGVVLDVLDGAVARRRGGTPLGPHLDSLADAATFGVAPAVTVAALHAAWSGGPGATIAYLGGLAYVTAALLRLADFDAGRHADGQFTGLPSPMGAVTALCVGFLAPTAWVAGLGLAITGWLMVSPLRYPRSRGFGLAAEAVGLSLGVAGLVGLLDLRACAAITLGIVTVAVPLANQVATTRAHRDGLEPSTLLRAEDPP